MKIYEYMGERILDLDDSNETVESSKYILVNFSQPNVQAAGQVLTTFEGHQIYNMVKFLFSFTY